MFSLWNTTLILRFVIHALYSCRVMWRLCANLKHRVRTFSLQADLKVRGQYYSTFAVFKDAAEADATFSGLEGQANTVCAENHELLANFLSPKLS